MALLQNKISKLERDVDDENTTSSFLSKAINDLMRETGRLQAEADVMLSSFISSFYDFISHY